MQPTLYKAYWAVIQAAVHSTVTSPVSSIWKPDSPLPLEVASQLSSIWQSISLIWFKSLWLPFCLSHVALCPGADGIRLAWSVHGTANWQLLEDTRTIDDLRSQAACCHVILMASSWHFGQIRRWRSQGESLYIFKWLLLQNWWLLSSSITYTLSVDYCHRNSWVLYIDRSTWIYLCSEYCILTGWIKYLSAPCILSCWSCAVVYNSWETPIEDRWTEQVRASFDFLLLFCRMCCNLFWLSWACQQMRSMMLTHSPGLELIPCNLLRSALTFLVSLTLINDQKPAKLYLVFRICKYCHTWEVTLYRHLALFTVSAILNQYSLVILHLENIFLLWARWSMSEQMSE